ncbi:VOC family protein [Streptomyces sp. NPDC057474]|uniref:VOC family protein n=1 Tax=Streptomyces sp. NPDC057474 TaxID=3346144 RepID=UPI00367F8725
MSNTNPTQAVPDADTSPTKPDDAPVHVSRLGYVNFETPDVARLTEYYTKVMGFALVDESPQQVFLTTGADHHCVVIEKAEAVAGRSMVGYEIRENLDDAQRRLKEVGITGERRTDIGPGTPDVLVLTEPATGATLHLYQEQDLSGVEPTFDQRPSKLGHVAAYTTSTSGMRSFYEDAMGFRWSDSIGDFFVFLRCNADHHAANFMQSDTMRGMHHIAYEARDLSHLQTMIDNLARNDYRLYWGPGRHAVGHNIFTYHLDPDGNHIELFTQLDVMLDEEKGYYEPRPWHEHFPMRPTTWEADALAMNAWGPIPHGAIKR